MAFLIYLFFPFSLYQISMSVKTQTPAARSALTRLAVTNVSVRKVTKLTQQPKHARPSVNISSFCSFQISVVLLLNSLMFTHCEKSFSLRFLSCYIYKDDKLTPSAD